MGTQDPHKKASTRITSVSGVGSETRGSLWLASYQPNSIFNQRDRQTDRERERERERDRDRQTDFL